MFVDKDLEWNIISNKTTKPAIIFNVESINVESKALKSLSHYY